MPNLASVLKQEIQRLARKETKTLIETVRKSAVQHRRDIAELKRQVATLTRTVAHLETLEKKSHKKPVPTELAEGARFSSRSVKAQRKRLGLSAANFGKLIGVSGLTVYNWELGKSRPRKEALAELVAARGLGKREAQRKLKLLNK